MDPLEWIGISASVLVLVSFCLRGEMRIRLISLVACVFFIVYGALIGALSIWLLNSLLIFVQTFFLTRHYLLAKAKATKNLVDDGLGDVGAADLTDVSAGGGDVDGDEV